MRIFLLLLIGATCQAQDTVSIGQYRTYTANQKVLWIVEGKESFGTSTTLAWDNSGLKVIDIIDNCGDTLKYEILVTGFIPNAFCPEGVNKTFKMEGMEVYNHWGTLIYKGNEWDGTFKGEKCPAGVYYYMGRFDGYKSGTITLLR